MDNFITYLSAFATKFPSYIPFIFIIGIITIILIRAHHSDSTKFSFFDTLVDSTTGKASLEKIGLLTGQLCLTWWFVDLAASQKATIEEALTYGGIMGLSKAYDTFIKNKYNTTNKE